MRIVLINPQFKFFNRREKTFSNCLGLLYIASYLRSKGHEVHFIDSLQLGFDCEEHLDNGIMRVGLSNEEIIKMVPEKTDLIGIGAPFSHLAPEVHALTKEIKSNLPDIPVVLGGVYPSSQPEMASTSDADYLILGEGEHTMEKLIQYIEDDFIGPPPPGVIPKTGLSSTDKVKAEVVQDLDALPFPARDMIQFEKYATHSQRNVQGWRSASIITSRGCPFNCEFCSVHSVVTRVWRKRSAENILSEIDFLVKNYRINLIEFEDDMLTLDRSRIVKILDGIIERNKSGQKIYWQAANGIRFDTVDEELLIKFKEANVREINFALEHGDKDLQKIINKKLDLSRVKEIMRLVDKHKIPANLFVIFGYPGETKERFENSIKFYKEIKQICPATKFRCFIAQPYPNTKLFQRAVRQGYLPADLFDNLESYKTFSTSSQVWIETEDFDKREVLRRKKVLYKAVSSKFGYIKILIQDSFPDFLVRFLYSIHYGIERARRDIQ